MNSINVNLEQIKFDLICRESLDTIPPSPVKPSPKRKYIQISTNSSASIQSVYKKIKTSAPENDPPKIKRLHKESKVSATGRTQSGDQPKARRSLFPIPTEKA